MAYKPKAASTAVAEPVNQQLLPDYDPSMGWAVDGADQVAGHDLAKDELLDALVGIPMLITRLTFREGIKSARTGKPSSYVSCEAVIAPEKELRRRRIDLDTLAFNPEDQIVFNDGSTGMFRQIVAYLAAKEIIELDESLPETGEYGETRYDVYIPDCKLNAGELRYREDGNWSYTVNVRLVAPRGIRVSTYTNDYNPNGSKTRYLA
jgi:hypothetical protein